MQPGCCSVCKTDLVRSVQVEITQCIPKLREMSDIIGSYLTSKGNEHCPHCGNLDTIVDCSTCHTKTILLHGKQCCQGCNQRLITVDLTGCVGPTGPLYRSYIWNPKKSTSRTS